MSPTEIIGALLKAAAAAIPAAVDAWHAEMAARVIARAELEAKAKAALAT